MFAAMFLGGFVPALASGDAKWLRFSTPQVEVFTDAGAGKGREVLRRFDQIRQVLLKTTNSPPKSGPPIRIFVFRSDQEFDAYKDPRRKTMAGFYQPGRDRDYIAMQNTGPEIYRVVFHEYVHITMKHSGLPVPLWLNEGTAELFSTVETTNSQIKIGEVIPAHILTLRHEKLIDLPTLMAVDHDSPLYNEQNKVGIFYAESWALVHMLNLNPQYTSGRTRLLGLLLTGTRPAQAFEQSYAKSPGEVLRDLQDYVNGNRFMGAVMKTDPLESIDKIEPDQLAPSESGLALADLLISLGKAREAEPRLTRLARENPNVAGIEEALGDTALAEHKQKDALAHYQRAIDIGSINARIYFEKADMERADGNDKQSVNDLRKAIELNPGYWQARHLLGFLYLRDHQFAQAIEQLRAAVRLEPRNVNIWQNLALAQFYQGDKDMALVAARQGRALASKPGEIASMDATIKEIEAPAPRFDGAAAPQTRQNTSVNQPVNQPGSKRVEGKLVQLDCSGAAAVFHVIAGTQTIALYVDDPHKVLLTNAPGHTGELTCGTFPARDVVVQYIARPNAEHKTAGEITALEFK